MNFKNLKIKNLLLNLLICLLYPIVKLIISKKLIDFSDACVIIGLVSIILGIVNSFFLHGDFDITSFVASRTLNKDSRSFEAYMKDQEAKRKDSFNYPLLCGILLLIISYLSALFV